MNCLFLCSELAGYFYNGIYVLAELHPELRITIVVQPKVENAPFQFEAHDNIEILSRYDLNHDGFISLIDRLNPKYVYMSGWIDREYRMVGRLMKNKCPVVMGIDNQWKGHLKQRVMEMAGKLWLKSFCNHVWVAGVRQYEYVRRIGFSSENILTGLYSADVSRFQKITSTAIEPQGQKSLLFMGNMWIDKGVVELVEAFQSLSADFPEWKLKLVGGGPLVESYQNVHKKIEVLGFVQPHEMQDLLSGTTAFCLPSYHDAWAVVIHEAACMGMPIIATDVCGSVTAFVHDGYNGFLCPSQDKEALKRSLKKMMKLSNEELKTFGLNSRSLSSQITPELWASKVFGFLSDKLV